MNIKYKLLNSFFAVTDKDNNIYYVSMNYNDAFEMQKFYEELNKDSNNLKFEITTIDTTSNIELTGFTSKTLDIKLKSKKITGGYYE